jgi:hypothetical protein
MRSIAQRNLDAEVKAVEAGHRAVVRDGAVYVVSDTRHDKRYRVETLPVYAGDQVTFLCQPEGSGGYQDDHLVAQATGVVPCMHAALLARRLEREGLVKLDNHGCWVATEKAPEFVYAGDPFEGLP